MIDRDFIAGLETPLENKPGHRVLDHLLNGPLEGARSVERIEADLGDLVERLIGDRQPQIPVSQPSLEALKLDAGDIPDVLATQGVKNNDFIDPIDELGTKVASDFAHDRFLDQIGVLAGQALNFVGPEIGRHDNDRVLEIDGAALPVGHAPIIERLQQHVENIRMRLLDFVEQDYAVGFSAN
jgi:hypothetical protein